MPVVVLEKPGVFAAFGRSRELVRGHGWPVFGTLVVTWLITIGVAIVGGIIVAALGGADVIRRSSTGCCPQRCCRSPRS